jgi:tetratricopeptide (TPR) repeat protein
MTKLAAIDEAIYTARDDEFLRALTMFLDVYGTDNAPSLQTAKAARGLSYFGLCLALVRKQYKEAIELCQRAIDLEFYNGDHYANMARVLLAQGNRKKAVEVAESGLKVAPESDYLTRTRATLGVRARPSVPFLDRANPINVSLGQARHAKKVADEEVAAPPARKRR